MKRSILNDVIGPLTRGPSSSHTTASNFIGSVVRDLCNDKMKSILISFDEEGSYGKVYKYQNSEYAFLSGLLGISMESPDFFKTPEIYTELGISATFQITQLLNADHPNVVELSVTSIDGKKTNVRAKSTGGGTISIEKFNAWDVSIDGQNYELLIEFPSKLEPEIQSILGREHDGLIVKIFETQKTSNQNGEIDANFIQIKLNDEIPTSWINILESLSGVSFWTIKPIFFVMKGDQLFQSAEEWLQYSTMNDLTLGEAALEYEMALLNLSKDEIMAEMEKRINIMLQSVEFGQKERVKGLKTIDSTASQISSASEKNKLFSNSQNTLTAVRAIASMEIASSGGYICAAPTGGSSGVIPAVLYTLHHEYQIDKKQLIYCAFAAAGIGLIHAIRSTFAAEVAGCQVEIGIAGAMAAASVCEAAGGSPKNGIDAAAISLQNTMGSVCDLVAGVCEIPCHTRNAISASNAFICCDLIMGGFVNPISLDDSIDASDASGKMLPPELRCTSMGGVAITPSAKKIIKDRGNLGDE